MSDIDTFVASVQRLKYTEKTWLKAISFVPFLGTVVRSAFDCWNLRSKFRVQRVLAEAGLSNGKLAVSVLTGLIALAVLIFLTWLFNPFEAGSSGSALIFTLILGIIAVILVPMVTSLLAVLIGTIDHARGKGQRGIILNSNLSHMASRNIFSPKQ